MNRSTFGSQANVFKDMDAYHPRKKFNRSCLSDNDEISVSFDHNCNQRSPTTNRQETRDHSPIPLPSITDAILSSIGGPGKMNPNRSLPVQQSNSQYYHYNYESDDSKQSKEDRKGNGNESNDFTPLSILLSR